MKNIKKFLLTMAMTMALGTSAFASSGFEFLLNWSGGIKIGIPNKPAKDIDYSEPNSIGLKAYEVLRYNGYNNLSTYLKKLEKK